MSGQAADVKTVDAIIAEAEAELPKKMFDRLYLAYHSRYPFWWTKPIDQHSYSLLVTIFESLTFLKEIHGKTNGTNPYYRAALKAMISMALSGYDKLLTREDYDDATHLGIRHDHPRPVFTRAFWQETKNDHESLFYSGD